MQSWITPIILLNVLFVSYQTYCQDSSKLDKIISVPDKFFSVLDKKTSSVEQNLDKATAKYLTKLQRQENKLKKKIAKKDSALARRLFDGVDEKYKQVKNTPGVVSAYATAYSGHLDSLTTSLRFIKDANPTANLSIQKTLDQYNELQRKLNATDQINAFIAHRRELLKEQLRQLGMVKELKRYRELVYYYQAQIREYKEMFEKPSMLEARLIETVMKMPQVRDFFSKNSTLSSLFAIPGSSASAATLSPALAGLQTRAGLTQLLTNRFGPSPNVAQQLQQSVQTAQGQMNELKNRIASFSSGSYGNGNADLPQGTRINSQKTKTFIQRLELGTNIQTQKSQYMFPVSSAVAVTLNYHLTDRAQTGIGISGSVGLGQSWSHVKISYQGAGIRSNLDWKIKGSIYLSGGYEMNYRSLIRSIDQLKNYSAWQTSGLIGVSKSYQVTKKLKGQMKLLWDFMSYSQVPQAQPILFRIGYDFK